jgi:hypothetical protein
VETSSWLTPFVDPADDLVALTRTDPTPPDVHKHSSSSSLTTRWSGPVKY